MKIYDNLQQGTNEWLEVRSGKFTGSDFHTLIGNSETKKKILFKKSIERLTKTTIIEEITSPDIERGKEEEKNARLLYEMETGQEVKQIGFAELDEWVGCSPDGLINNDGIIEIKCPKDVIFAQQVITGNITASNGSDTYKIAIRFKETGENQNTQQGKSASAVVTCKITGGTVYYNNSNPGGTTTQPTGN